MPRVPQSRPNPARVAEEQVWCYDQKLRGKSLRAISAASAEALGRSLSTTTVYERIESEIATRVQPKAAELRQMELDRLDEQEARIRDAMDRQHYVLHGGEIVHDPETGQPLINEKFELEADDRLLRIGERRAKLLGIDAPVATTSDVVVRYEMVDIDSGKLG